MFDSSAVTRNHGKPIVMKFFQLRIVLNPFLSLRFMPRPPLELPAAAKRWYHLRRKKCLGVAAHQVTMSCVDIRIFVCIFSNEKKAKWFFFHVCDFRTIIFRHVITAPADLVEFCTIQ